ncbi:MAG TPA: hypothetical protein VEB21_04535 [Terriglobales bacterium]|nr:hypothetical protein [Terriglobales bacterium]
MDTPVETSGRLSQPDAGQANTLVRGGRGSTQWWLMLSPAGGPLHIGAGVVPPALPAGDRVAAVLAELPDVPLVIAISDDFGGKRWLDTVAALLRTRSHVALATSGAGIDETIAAELRRLGIERLHIPFHSARQDAHDFLAGTPGALKTAHRAIRAARSAGLPVTAEVTLTRPTVAVLPETMELLGRLGVRHANLRRLAVQHTDPTSFVPLSPRLSLIEKSLEAAATIALRRRIRIVLRDFPVCVAPRLRPLFAARQDERWLGLDGKELVAPAGTRCPTCPGSKDCCGAAGDYVARFGCEELLDLEYDPARLAESVAEQQAEPASPPMVFGWRGPERMICRACADPASGPWLTADSRTIRARLVQAARHRPALLRLVGADLLAHPDAPSLLFDAVRLFPRVQVAAEASPLADWSDLDLRRLKELDRFDVALYGPDAPAHDSHCGIAGAFERMQRGIERLHGESGVAAGAYAVLHDPRLVPTFAAAWDAGKLPGEPRFRLSGAGASLNDLARCTQELPAGPARSALQALLPRCRGGATQRQESLALAHRTIHFGNSTPHRVCGSDVFGEFVPCSDDPDCNPERCVGIAAGWDLVG